MNLIDLLFPEQRIILQKYQVRMSLKQNWTFVAERSIHILKVYSTGVIN